MELKSKVVYVCLFFTLNGICNRIGMTINYWIWVYSYDFVYDAVKDDQ